MPSRPNYQTLKAVPTLPKIKIASGGRTTNISLQELQVDLSQAELLPSAATTKAAKAPIEFRNMKGVPRLVKFSFKKQQERMNRSLDEDYYVHK